MSARPDNSPLLKDMTSIEPYVLESMSNILREVVPEPQRKILSLLVTRIFLSKHVRLERGQIFYFCKIFSNFISSQYDSASSSSLSPLNPSTAVGRAASESSPMMQFFVGGLLVMSPLGLLINKLSSDQRRIDEMLEPRALLAGFLFSNIEVVKEIVTLAVVSEIEKMSNKNERDIIYIGAITEQWHYRIEELAVLVKSFPQLSIKPAQYFFSQNVLGTERWASELFVMARALQYLPTTMRECSILEGLALYIKVCHSQVWESLVQAVGGPSAVADNGVSIDPLSVIKQKKQELTGYLQRREYKKLFESFFKLFSIKSEEGYHFINNVSPLVYTIIASSVQETQRYNSKLLSSFVGSVCEGIFDGILVDEGERAFYVYGAAGSSSLAAKDIKKFTKDSTQGVFCNFKVDTRVDRKGFLQALGFYSGNDIKIFKYVEELLEASRGDLNQFFQSFVEALNVVLAVATVNLDGAISGSAKLFQPQQKNSDTLNVAISVDREGRFYTTEVVGISPTTGHSGMQFRHSNTDTSAVFAEVVERLGQRIDPEFKIVSSGVNVGRVLSPQELAGIAERQELVVDSQAAAVLTSQAFDISSEPSDGSDFSYEEVVMASVLGRNDLLSAVNIEYLKGMDKKPLNPIVVAGLLGGDILSRCQQEQRQRALPAFTDQLVSQMRGDHSDGNAQSGAVENSGSVEGAAQTVSYLTKEGGTALKAITILKDTSFNGFSDGVSKGVIIPFKDLNKPVFTRGKLTVAGLIAMGGDTPALHHITGVESYFGWKCPLGHDEFFVCFELAVQYNNRALITLFKPRLDTLVIPSKLLLECLRFAIKHVHEDLIELLALKPGASASRELVDYLGQSSTSRALLRNIASEALSGMIKTDPKILKLVQQPSGVQSSSSGEPIPRPTSAYVLDRVSDISTAIAHELFDSPSSVGSTLALGSSWNVRELQEKFIRAYPNAILVILHTQQKTLSVASRSSSSGLQVREYSSLFPYPDDSMPSDSTAEVVIAVDEFNHVYTVIRRADISQGVYLSTDHESEIVGKEAEVASQQLARSFSNTDNPIIPFASCGSRLIQHHGDGNNFVEAVAHQLKINVAIILDKIKLQKNWNDNDICNAFVRSYPTISLVVLRESEIGTYVVFNSNNPSGKRLDSMPEGTKIVVAFHENKFYSVEDDPSVPVGSFLVYYNPWGILSSTSNVVTQMQTQDDDIVASSAAEVSSMNAQSQLSDDEIMAAIILNNFRLAQKKSVSVERLLGIKRNGYALNLALAFENKDAALAIRDLERFSQEKWKVLEDNMLNSLLDVLERFEAGERKTEDRQYLIDRGVILEGTNINVCLVGLLGALCRCRDQKAKMDYLRDYVVHNLSGTKNIENIQAKLQASAVSNHEKGLAVNVLTSLVGHEVAQRLCDENIVVPYVMAVMSSSLSFIDEVLLWLLTEGRSNSRDFINLLSVRNIPYTDGSSDNMLQRLKNALLSGGPISYKAFYDELKTKTERTVDILTPEGQVALRALQTNNQVAFSELDKKAFGSITVAEFILMYPGNTKALYHITSGTERATMLSISASPLPPEKLSEYFKLAIKYRNFSAIKVLAVKSNVSIVDFDELLPQDIGELRYILEILGEQSSTPFGLLIEDKLRVLERQSHASNTGPSRAYILGPSYGAGYEGFVELIKAETCNSCFSVRVSGDKDIKSVFQAFVNQGQYSLKVLSIGAQYSENIYTSGYDGSDNTIEIVIVMDENQKFYQIREEPRDVAVGFYIEGSGGVLERFRVYEGTSVFGNSRLSGLLADTVDRTRSLFNLPLVTTIPPQKPGLSLEIIDSAEIQCNTKACADNAFIIARKVQVKGYEVMLYEQHVGGRICHLSVIAYRPDDISRAEWLQEVHSAEIPYNPTEDQEYRDAMGVPKVLYLQGSAKSYLEQLKAREEQLIEAIEVEANVENQTSVQLFSLELLFSWLQMVQDNKLMFPLNYYPRPPYKDHPDDDWGGDNGGNKIPSNDEDFVGAGSNITNLIVVGESSKVNNETY